MKPSIDHVIIETTRRCNMSCGHCLRGDSHPKDTTQHVVEAAFDGIDHINVLTIGGGESACYPEGIMHVVRAIENTGVTVGSFYIPTNGKRYTKDYILALLELYLCVEDTENCMMQVSRSDFHADEGQDESEIEKLRAFRFVEERPHLRENNPGIIDMGRASSFATKRLQEDVPIIEDGNVTEGNIYVTVDGNVVNGCDWSYCVMDSITEGNVLEDSLFNIVERMVD
jgi:hypothetical protein